MLITNPEAEEQLFFSASTSSPQWNDVDRDNSIWRITLENEDHERVDGKVKRLLDQAKMVWYLKPSGVAPRPIEEPLPQRGE